MLLLQFQTTAETKTRRFFTKHPVCFKGPGENFKLWKVYIMIVTKIILQTLYLEFSSCKSVCTLINLY